ncbi:MAG: ATP-binding protein [Burkholderiaceae bacterium]
MSVQRRLLAWLMLVAVAIWATVGIYAYLSANHEIDELFDTQQVALAGYVLSSQGLPAADRSASGEIGRQGEADLGDMAIALWTSDGYLLVSSGHHGVLPFNAHGSGFERRVIDGEPWIIYYQRDDRLGRVAAVGNSADERKELLADLVAGQLMPWVVMLPVLIIGMVIAIRVAFRPLRSLASAVEMRGVDDLTPIDESDAARDVAPLVQAMNRLFGRIGAAIEHERRLTADASHELRTPLAALRAQWDAASLSVDPGARERAMGKIGQGLDRLSHLVDQLLRLSALESSRPQFQQPVNWPTVVQRAIGDSLAAIEATDAEVGVNWPPDGAPAMPLIGDDTLMALALRNLIDNACRYGPARVRIELSIGSEKICVQDDGPGLPAEVVERLGDRFLRGSANRASGSGLGISIVARVAELHDLDLRFENLGGGDESPPAGGGLRVTLARRQRPA